MIHRYPRARRVAWVATDVLLAAAAVFLAFSRPEGTLGHVLAIAIPAVLLFGLLTLHYPRVVELDDRGVRFSAYGRAHRYEWSAIDRVHVRKFLVRDRVLVRITPAAPWRGRYWILSAIDGYDALIKELEDRAPARTAPSHGKS
jgi:hypothetical protein